MAVVCGGTSASQRLKGLHGNGSEGVTTCLQGEVNKQRLCNCVGRRSEIEKERETIRRLFWLPLAALLVVIGTIAGAQMGPGYYEVNYTDENGSAIPQDKEGKPSWGNRPVPRLITTTFIWHPSSADDEPPQCVIVTEEGISDPAHPRKATTRYQVIQNPGLRYTMTTRDLVH